MNRVKVHVRSVNGNYEYTDTLQSGPEGQPDFPPGTILLTNEKGAAIYLTPAAVAMMFRIGGATPLPPGAEERRVRAAEEQAKAFAAVSVSLGRLVEIAMEVHAADKELKAKHK